MKRFFALGLGLLGIVFASVTYERTVTSKTDFVKEIQKFSHAIVIFYQSKFDTKEERKEFRKRFRDARRAFDKASKMKRYKDASLAFLRVDVDRESVEGLARRYGVDELPTYMLFLDGQPFKTAQGVSVRRSGFLDKEAIVTLIERHYRSDIDATLKELARLRQRQREERMESGWSPYFYWGYGGGYPYGNPYYYYPPYGGRAGFGFYVGG